MKKGDTAAGKVERMIFPNKGIVCAGDEKVFVADTLPGQSVSFRIQKKRKGRLEGFLLSVDERSPLETQEPGCANFGLCGGCSYLGLSYEDQLKLKKEQIRQLFAELIPGFDDIFEGIKSSDAHFAYRNKMEYSFGDAQKGGELTLGLHKKHSNYDILTADGCRLVHDDLNRIVSCVLQYCREKELPYYHKNTHEGFLRHLLLRRTQTGEILAAIVTTTQLPADLQGLAERIAELPLDGTVKGIVHMENDLPADTVQCRRMNILAGTPVITEKLCGLYFRISPFSFFQTNTKGAEVLYNTVKEYIGDIEDAVVYDLYSGTGTIAQILSAAAKKVYGIEIVEEAVLAARENAAVNGVTNCEFIAGDVLKELDNIPEEPDFLILDPPREGVNPRALHRIIKYGASRIVYVSCKPTSLVRDLEAFLNAGYEVTRMACVDMFPMTVHVETIVLITKNTKKML